MPEPGVSVPANPSSHTRSAAWPSTETAVGCPCVGAAGPQGVSSGAWETPPPRRDSQWREGSPHTGMRPARRGPRPHGGWGGCPRTGGARWLPVPSPRTPGAGRELGEGEIRSAQLRIITIVELMTQGVRQSQARWDSGHMQASVTAKDRRWIGRLLLSSRGSTPSFVPREGEVTGS